MSPTRNQTYLTAQQRERIDRVARARGITMAAVIRTAVDQYLDDSPDPDAALASTFGADPAAGVPLRDEWDRRDFEKVRGLRLRTLA
jgi:hypothetical protein